MSSQGLFKKILVPLDGTGFAESALRQACELAKGLQAQIHLVRVCTPLAPLPRAYGYSIAVPFHLDGMVHPMTDSRKIEERADRYLERLQTTLEEEGIVCTREVRHGRAGDAISKVLEESAIDLVVVASHRPIGFARWLSGSLVKDLCRQTECPVMIVRGDERRSPFAEWTLQHNVWARLEPFVGDLAETARLDAALVREAAPRAVAMLLGGLATERDQGPGLREVVKELRFFDGPIGDIKDYLKDGHSGADLGLVSHIFNAQSSAAAAALAKDCPGLDDQGALDLLAFLAPIVLSEVVATAEDSSELRALLERELRKASGREQRTMQKTQELLIGGD